MSEQQSMFQSPKTIRLLTVVLLTALQAIVLVFVIIPLFQSGARTAGEVSQENSRQSVYETQIEQAKAQAGQLDALREQFSQLQHSIPSTIDQDGFLRSVNDIVAQNGVQLTGITWKDAISYGDFTKVVQDYPVALDQPTADQQDAVKRTKQALDAVAGDGHLQAVPLEITVQGANYDYASGFVQAAQSMDRIFWVNGVSVQEVSVENGQKAYQTVLSGYTFIRAA